MKVIFLEDYRNAMQQQASATKKVNGYKNMNINISKDGKTKKWGDRKNSDRKRLTNKIVWLLVLGLIAVAVFVALYFVMH